MLEIIQSKGEELLRREEEGKTMRLLYESEVRERCAPTYRPADGPFRIILEVSVTTAVLWHGLC